MFQLKNYHVLLSLIRMEYMNSYILTSLEVLKSVSSAQKSPNDSVFTLQ